MILADNDESDYDKLNEVNEEGRCVVGIGGAASLRHFQ